MERNTSLDSRTRAALLLNLEAAEAALDRLFRAIESAQAVGFPADGLWANAIRLDARISKLSAKL